LMSLLWLPTYPWDGDEGEVVKGLQNCIRTPTSPQP